MKEEWAKGYPAPINEAENTITQVRLHSFKVLSPYLQMVKLVFVAATQWIVMDWVPQDPGDGPGPSLHRGEDPAARLQGGSALEWWWRDGGDEGNTVGIRLVFHVEDDHTDYISDYILFVIGKMWNIKREWRGVSGRFHNQQGCLCLGTAWYGDHNQIYPIVNHVCHLYRGYWDWQIRIFSLNCKFFMKLICYTGEHDVHELFPLLVVNIPWTRDAEGNRLPKKSRAGDQNG